MILVLILWYFGALLIPEKRFMIRVIYKLEQEVPHVEERRFQAHWLEDEIRTRK
jgi:hypothetical protein